MKKILHICQSTHGGAAEYVNLVITHLDKLKYTHTLICPSDGDLIKKAYKQKIKIYPLEMQRQISPFKDLKDILSIRKILQKEKADILFLHSSKAGALGRLAALFQNTKIIYNPHGWAFNMQCSKAKKNLYLLIEKLLYPFTDMIINISQDEYHSALINRFPASKLCIVENGIEIARFTPPYTHYISEKKFLNQFVIGFTGRLAEQKNPLFLINICEELLKQKEDNFIFYIIGDGELRPVLEEQIKCKNLEKYFFFCGWSGQVEKEINNFDMALMVSKWEGFGLVVCEYMAAQKPIVSVAVGGVKNILNQYNSFMIEDYSCEQFAQKIMKIRYGSKQEIQRMIDHAYQDVKKKYSIEIMVKNLEALISQ